MAHLAIWDPEKKSFELFIFHTKYVIQKSLQFSHWPSNPKAPDPSYGNTRPS